MHLMLQSTCSNHEMASELRRRESLGISRRAGSWAFGAYGRFSKVHVLNVLPDPRALNPCMRTFPKKAYRLTMV